MMAGHTTTISALDELYKEAEYWFTAAELDILNGTYFPTDPTKEKIPERIRNHNTQIKRENFISAQEKLTEIKNKYLAILKPIIADIDLQERKRLMVNRYDFEKMNKACDHYIKIFS